MAQVTGFAFGAHDMRRDPQFLGGLAFRKPGIALAHSRLMVWD